MMESLKLMEYVEAIGHEFSLEGEKLRIAKGKHLPNTLKNEILYHKNEWIGILQRDQQANSIGFMIGLPGTLYTRTVSHSSVAYIEIKNNEWYVWRETYQRGRIKAISTKTIAQSKTFEYALKKADNYFRYVTSKNL
jgi:hypothetical protein